MTSHQQAQAQPGPAATEPPSLREAAAGVLDGTRRQLAELLELMTLELRYSGLMLGGVLALAVIAALAAVSVWGLLNAALVSGLMALGWPLAGALLGVAGVNLILVFASAWLALRAASRVGLDGTRQVLGLESRDADD